MQLVWKQIGNETPRNYLFLLPLQALPDLGLPLPGLQHTQALPTLEPNLIENESAHHQLI